MTANFLVPKQEWWFFCTFVTEGFSSASPFPPPPLTSISVHTFPNLFPPSLTTSKSRSNIDNARVGLITLRHLSVPRLLLLFLLFLFLFLFLLLLSPAMQWHKRRKRGQDWLGGGRLRENADLSVSLTTCFDGHIEGKKNLGNSACREKRKGGGLKLLFGLALEAFGKARDQEEEEEKESPEVWLDCKHLVAILEKAEQIEILGRRGFSRCCVAWGKPCPPITPTQKDKIFLPVTNHRDSTDFSWL